MPKVSFLKTEWIGFAQAAWNVTFRVALAIGIIALVCLGGCLYHTRRQWSQFDHLEQNARKVITAAELQAWATNVLANYQTYSPAQIRQLRTNYPAKLRRLVSGLDPDVCINEVNSINTPGDWTNYPSSISLIWGTGFLGHEGFEVGPTNFISSSPRAHAWGPGVYYYSRR